MQKSDAEWRKTLTDEEYRVLRENGTEISGSGTYVDMFEDGIYRCKACGAELFQSDSKYESTEPGLIGWPAFSEAASSGAVKLRDDKSHGMHRTEVTCANCGSHLGHLFPDDSSPNGQHYCINSICLNFEKNKTS